jgi:hypothetical protein
MPEDAHCQSEILPSADDDVPVEQLVTRIKSSRATANTADAAQQVIEKSRRRRAAD